MAWAEDTEARIAALPCWRGTPHIAPLSGGMTNHNFVVRDGGQRFVARLGEDIPAHRVVRAHEVAAARAAYAAGLSPEMVYAEAGVTVQRFIDGRTLTPADLRQPARLAPVIDLVRRCHHDVPRHLDGPAGRFDVFAILRFYAASLKDGGSAYAPQLERLMACAAALEARVGTDAAVFGHNDLIAANFIDDGTRLWLIDWDYAGFNVPLFDLGGLAANSDFPADLEHDMLALYFGRIDDALPARYAAMKTAALLREAMWAMVAEITSTISFDFAGYTRDNLQRFERAWSTVARS